MPPEGTYFKIQNDPDKAVFQVKDGRLLSYKSAGQDLSSYGVNYSSLPAYNTADIIQPLQQQYFEKYLRPFGVTAATPNIQDAVSNPANFFSGAAKAERPVTLSGTPDTHLPSGSIVAPGETENPSLPKVGDIIPGSNLRYEVADIQNLSSGSPYNKIPQPTLESIQAGIDALHQRIAAEGVTNAQGKQVLASTLPGRTGAGGSQANIAAVGTYSKTIPSVDEYIKSLQAALTTSQTSAKTASEKYATEAGSPSNSALAIYKAETERRGLATEESILNTLNKQIIDYQEQVRKLPESLKLSLADVGVTQAQLDRIILKDQKPLVDQLAHLMDLKGAEASYIENMRQDTGQYTNFAVKDEAVKLAALQWDAEQKQKSTDKLTDDQFKLLTSAREEQKLKLVYAEDAWKAGATQAQVDAITKADTPEKALALLGQVKYTKVDTSPSVIGTAETGYFQYNPAANTWTKITGIGGGGGGTKINFTDIMQQSIDAGATPEQAAREAAMASEKIGIQVDQKTLSTWTEQAKTLKKNVIETSKKTRAIEYGTGNFANVSFEDRVTQLKSIFGNNEFSINAALKQNGYKSQVGLSGIVTPAANAVKSFFSNLFGS